MSKNNQTNPPEKAPAIGEGKEAEIEAGRAAYMIAWRDRHIESLKETIAGLQEESRLMEALLAFALYRAAAPQEDGARVLDSPKEALRAMLGAWKSSVEADETAYHLTFREKKEAEDGAHPAQDQGE